MPSIEQVSSVPVVPEKPEKGPEPRRPSSDKKKGSFMTALGFAAALHGVIPTTMKVSEAASPEIHRIQRNVEELKRHEEFNALRQRIIAEAMQARERGESRLPEAMVRLEAINIQEFERREVNVETSMAEYRRLSESFDAALQEQGGPTIEHIGAALHTAMQDYDYQGNGGNGYAVDMLADKSGPCVPTSEVVAMIVTRRFPNQVFLRVYPPNEEGIGHMAPIFQVKDPDGTIHEYDLTAGRQAAPHGATIRFEDVLGRVAEQMHEEPGFVRSRLGSLRGEAHRDNPSSLFSLPKPADARPFSAYAAVPVFARGSVASPHFSQPYVESPPPRPERSLSASERESRRAFEHGDMHTAAEFLQVNLDPLITRAEPGVVSTEVRRITYELNYDPNAPVLPPTEVVSDVSPNETGHDFTRDDWERLSMEMTKLDGVARRMQKAPEEGPAAVMDQVAVDGLRLSLLRVVRSQSHHQHRGASERWAVREMTSLGQRLEGELSQVTPEMVGAGIAEERNRPASLPTNTDELIESRLTGLLQTRRGQEIAWRYLESQPASEQMKVSVIGPFLLHPDSTIRSRALSLVATLNDFAQMSVLVTGIGQLHLGPEQATPRFEGSDAFSRMYRFHQAPTLSGDNFDHGTYGPSDSTIAPTFDGLFREAARVGQEQGMSEAAIQEFNLEHIGYLVSGSRRLSPDAEERFKEEFRSDLRIARDYARTIPGDRAARVVQEVTEALDDLSDPGRYIPNP